MAQHHRHARPGELARLLARIPPGTDHAGRLDALSAALVGRPYVVGPLEGGPGRREALVTRVDAFDCVTYVETVLALARCRVPGDLPGELEALRYHHGRRTWADRNHYTSDWLDRNVRAGLLRPLLAEHWIGVPRRLSVLEGYPVRSRVVSWLPAERVGLLEPVAVSGDFAGFASTRPELDTFHVGLLVPAPGELRLRHASRSRGEVVEVSLSGFLERNETPGLLVARPLPRPGEA